jgi:hypothetical protein
MRLPFTTDLNSNLGHADEAIILPTDDHRTALIEACWQGISTHLNITVGDVTMHAAAWEDPDHWAEDWAEKLGCDYDEAPGAVDALLEAAVIDG